MGQDLCWPLKTPELVLATALPEKGRGSQFVRTIFILLSSLLVSLGVKAQFYNEPFALASGLYVVECWAVNIVQDKAGKLQSTSEYQRGMVLALTGDGVSRESFLFWGDGGEKKLQMIRKVTSKKLEGQNFLQTFEIEMNGSTEIYEAKVSVSSNVTRFLSAVQGGKAVNVNGREAVWHRMVDGRVMTQDYALSGIKAADGSMKRHDHRTCHFIPSRSLPNIPDFKIP